MTDILKLTAAAFAAPGAAAARQPKARAEQPRRRSPAARPPQRAPRMPPPPPPQTRKGDAGKRVFLLAFIAEFALAAGAVCLFPAAGGAVMDTIASLIARPADKIARALTGGRAAPAPLPETPPFREPPSAAPPQRTPPDEPFPEERGGEEALPPEDFTEESAYAFPPAHGRGEVPEGALLDASGALVSQTDGEDFLVLLSAASGGAPALNTLSGEDARFTQTRFDSRLRIISRLVWLKKDGIYQPEKQTLLHYSGEDSRVPDRRETLSPGADGGDGAKEEIRYSKDGLILSRNVSRAAKDEAGKSIQVPVSETSFTYDASQRVTKQVERTYSTGGEAREEITTYRYTAAKEPDTELYRNGSFVKRIAHGADGSRTETRALTPGYTVESRYEHGTLKSERFLRNGIELRRNDY